MRVHSKTTAGVQGRATVDVMSLVWLSCFHNFPSQAKMGHVHIMDKPIYNLSEKKLHACWSIWGNRFLLPFWEKKFNLTELKKSLHCFYILISMLKFYIIFHHNQLCHSIYNYVPTILYPSTFLYQLCRSLTLSLWLLLWSHPENICLSSPSSTILDILILSLRKTSGSPVIHLEHLLFVCWLIKTELLREAERFLWLYYDHCLAVVEISSFTYFIGSL